MSTEGWPVSLSPSPEMLIVESYRSRRHRIAMWFRLRLAVHRGYRTVRQTPMRMPLLEVQWPHYRRLRKRTYELENQVARLQRQVEALQKQQVPA